MEHDVAAVRRFMLSVIERIVSKDKLEDNDYVLLRNTVSCRLTMFNAR